MHPIGRDIFRLRGVWPAALLLAGVFAVAAFAEEDAGGARRAQLTHQIETRLSEYALDFPELRFLVVEGAPEAALPQLQALLGPEPASLDYAHPADTRELLMTAVLQRIRLMLEHEAPSATLLRADHPEGESRPLCVITLAPCAVARDDLAATCHLLALPPELVERIDRERWLPCEDYLRFVLDHEVFHCLDAWHNGPQPMSERERWAGYWQYRGENGADTFAMARHVQTRGDRSAFAANFARIRDWSLLEGDVDHWTGLSLARVQAAGLGLVGMRPDATLAWASRTRDAVVGDYDRYLTYRASVAEALRRAGDEDEFPGLDVHPDPALVAELIARSIRASTELAP